MLPAEPGGAETESDREFLAELPALEELTPGSDVRAFLDRRVPQALRRAALRRAWSVDPAIRDYVGPADYAWDFNVPDAAQGFGSLTVGTDVETMVRQVLGERPVDAVSPFSAERERDGEGVPEPALSVEGPGEGEHPHPSPPPLLAEEGSGTASVRPSREQLIEEDTLAASVTDPVAEPSVTGSSVAGVNPGPLRRRHGGAIPR